MSGLFGNVLGAISGGQQGGDSMASVLSGLLSNEDGQGGLQGLVQKFTQGGAGDLIQSWVGKGENLPISAEQLQGVLGSDMLSGLAAKLGVDPGQAAGQLSNFLPGLIDKLTPDGSIPEGGVGGGLGNLAGMFGGLLKR